jgi:hypothetical protein
MHGTGDSMFGNGGYLEHRKMDNCRLVWRGSLKAECVCSRVILNGSVLEHSERLEDTCISSPFSELLLCYHLDFVAQ